MNRILCELQRAVGTAAGVAAGEASLSIGGLIIKVVGKGKATTLKVTGRAPKGVRVTRQSDWPNRARLRASGVTFEVTGYAEYVDSQPNEISYGLRISRLD